MPSDILIGYLIVGVGIVFVLGLVFGISSRQPRQRPKPPRGVHMPNPSPLPFIFSLGAAFLGAALAFHPKGLVVNVFLAIPAVAIIVYGAVAWVRAAGREWQETESSPHDEVGEH
jgi:hypothetical protein